MNYRMKDYRFHRITRITGPTHNFLGLSFTDQAESIRMGSLFLEENCSCPVVLEPLEVKEHVLRGVEEANQDLGTGYKINYIEYVANDSGPAPVYEMLASCIVHHMHELGDEYGKRQLPDFFFLHGRAQADHREEP